MSHNSHIAVRAEGLSKRYRLGAAEERHETMVGSIAAALRAPFTNWRNVRKLSRFAASDDADQVWALKDVSFEVREGEVVGIIGRNGAGKSTLLKILCRITDPTAGRAEIAGRIGSLLEVGTGFHPDLTGRENVYINGTILGMRKREIDTRFEEIVEFAEVSKYIDTPVKRYSSGMRVRLAFSVAAHLQPDILIVDEVLAVGDAQFQKKCLTKLNDAAAGGRAVLFVSHNMQAVQQLCSRAILLENGQNNYDGDCAQAIHRYLHSTSHQESLTGLNRIIERLPQDPAFRLQEVDIVQAERSGTEIITGAPTQIVVTYDVLQEVAGLHIWISLLDADGTLIFESLHNGHAPDIPMTSPGRYQSVGTIPANFLAGRNYELEINAAIHRVRECVPQPSPLRIPLNATEVGLVNRAYSGYATRGKISPLIAWETRVVAPPANQQLEPALECHPGS
jgi:lipopolysaccharide transport system ATP-binding protein